MTEKSTSSATASIGFPVASLAVFVMFVLKVAGMAGASWGLADLSWLWVFAPWLIVLGLVILFLVLAGIFAGMAIGGAALLDKRDAKNRAKARATKRLR